MKRTLSRDITAIVAVTIIASLPIITMKASSHDIVVASVAGLVGYMSKGALS